MPSGRFDRSKDGLVPLALAALARRETREQTLRHVMRGDLPGGLYAGRWYVEAAHLPGDPPGGGDAQRRAS